MKLSKKYTVKIPKNIKIIYNNKQNLVTFIGPENRKTLKPKFKLFFENNSNYIYVTNTINVDSLNNNNLNKLKALRGLTVAYIKQTIFEVSTLLNIKIALIGVGFKVFPVNFHEHELLQFKLGFSHFIYYKVPKNVKITSLKSTVIHIFGNSYYLINQIAATIRSYKIPEPYKGKGVLYENEKIKLKEGKKI